MLRASLPFITALLTAGLLAGCSSTPEDKTAAWSPSDHRSQGRAQQRRFRQGSAFVRKAGGPRSGYAPGPAVGNPQSLCAIQGWRRRCIATLYGSELHPARSPDWITRCTSRPRDSPTTWSFLWISQQDLSERDQKAAKDSFESFSELATRFPTAGCQHHVCQRMTYIVNSLAQYEVHVARYYYQRGAYVAAIGRAQVALPGPGCSC